MIRKIYKTRNNFSEEIKHNALISKKHNKTCMILNYIEHLLTSACTFAICVSISAFAFIVGIPEGITSFAVELKI